MDIALLFIYSSVQGHLGSCFLVFCLVVVVFLTTTSNAAKNFHDQDFIKTCILNSFGYTPNSGITECQIVLVLQSCLPLFLLQIPGCGNRSSRGQLLTLVYSLQPLLEFPFSHEGQFLSYSSSHLCISCLHSSQQLILLAYLVAYSALPQFPHSVLWSMPVLV